MPHETRVPQAAFSEDSAQKTPDRTGNAPAGCF